MTAHIKIEAKPGHEQDLVDRFEFTKLLAAIVKQAGGRLIVDEATFIAIKPKSKLVQYRTPEGEFVFELKEPK